MTTVNLTTPVDAAEFWSTVMGSGWETYSWWHTVAYLDGASWDTPGRVTVTIESPDSAGYRKATFGLDDLVASWNALVAAGHRDACTGKPFCVDDVDACVGDEILQHVTLGEVVYG